MVISCYHQRKFLMKFAKKLVHILDLDPRWDLAMYKWIGKKYLQDLQDVT